MFCRTLVVNVYLFCFKLSALRRVYVQRIVKLCACKQIDLLHFHDMEIESFTFDWTSDLNAHKWPTFKPSEMTISAIQYSKLINLYKIQ